jgi:hypothetical protein
MEGSEENGRSRGEGGGGGVEGEVGGWVGESERVQRGASWDEGAESGAKRTEG